MEKSLALLLASLLLAGCHMKPTAEQERQSAEVARQNTAEQERKSEEVARQNDEAVRNRQAEEAANKLREELGDEIESRINDWSGEGQVSDLPRDYYTAFSHTIGYKFSSSKMFINRKTGVLTIVLNCQFFNNSTEYLPLLVRLFDENGQYLTHFETSEIYGKSVENHNSDHNVGGHYMKELKDRSTIQYSINLRDAAFIKQGEVGFHFTNGMFLQQLQLNRRAN
jgi:hypothetical protein